MTTTSKNAPTLLSVLNSTLSSLNLLIDVKVIFDEKALNEFEHIDFFRAHLAESIEQAKSLPNDEHRVDVIFAYQEMERYLAHPHSRLSIDVREHWDTLREIRSLLWGQRCKAELAASLKVFDEIEWDRALRILESKPTSLSLVQDISGSRRPLTAQQSLLNRDSFPSESENTDTVGKKVRRINSDWENQNPPLRCFIDGTGKDGFFINWKNNLD